jgi:hypothetical protein
MADEIQFMHEELTNLSNEIQSGLDELKKNSKRLAADVRDQKVFFFVDSNQWRVFRMEEK